jgi:hypothetical protein
MVFEALPVLITSYHPPALSPVLPILSEIGPDVVDSMSSIST